VSKYQVTYEDESLGPQIVSDDDGKGLSIEDAFHIAAGESADAFFASGGNSYDCTDTSYAVQPRKK
jgi:hypothetical protein